MGEGQRLYLVEGRSLEGSGDVKGGAALTHARADPFASAASAPVVHPLLVAFLARRFNICLGGIFVSPSKSMT